MLRLLVSVAILLSLQVLSRLRVSLTMQSTVSLLTAGSSSKLTGTTLTARLTHQFLHTTTVL